MRGFEVERKKKGKKKQSRVAASLSLFSRARQARVEEEGKEKTEQERKRKRRCEQKKAKFFSWLTRRLRVELASPLSRPLRGRRARQRRCCSSIRFYFFFFSTEASSAQLAWPLPLAPCPRTVSQRATQFTSRPLAERRGEKKGESEEEGVGERDSRTPNSPLERTKVRFNRCHRTLRRVRIDPSRRSDFLFSPRELARCSKECNHAD